MEIIAFILLIFGLIGCIVPIIPGPFLAFCSLLILHNFTQYNFELYFLWLLFFVVLSITFLDYWLQIYGVKKFGGGKKAINGAIIGLIIGLFFPPVGLVLGPFLGSYIGAIMEKDKYDSSSIKIAFGSFFGFIGGVFLKISITIYIAFLFINQFFTLW